MRSTDFRLEPETKQRLFDNGSAAAEAFLDTWDYARWRQLYADAAPAPAVA